MAIQFPKKFLPLIVAAACGLIAVALINTYIQQQAEEARKEQLKKEKNSISVVVAKQDIPAGEVIKESMLKEEIVSKYSLQPKAATSIDRVVDKITAVPIYKGGQVLLSQIAVTGQQGSLSMKVPVGKRAITVSVDNISSVGGMLKPGDHVDVLGMVPLPGGVNAEGKQVSQLGTMPLFQDVLVLAVGQDFTNIPGLKKEERPSTPVVTLALAPKEANIVTFMQEQNSKIKLVLRAPGDAQSQPAEPMTWDILLRTLLPQLTQKQEIPVPVKPKPTVEIYRGLNKEIRTLE